MNIEQHLDTTFIHIRPLEVQLFDPYTSLDYRLGRDLPGECAPFQVDIF